jgi:oligopeptide transport system permease protein
MVLRYILFAVIASILWMFIVSKDKYQVLKRILLAILILLVISLPYHYIVTHAPGDPIDIIAGPGASQEVRDRVAEEYGLNDPYFVQYGRWLKGFITGDWGESYRLRGESVEKQFNDRALVSAPLGLTSAAIVIPFGVAIGLFMAWRQGTWFDNLFFAGGQIFLIIPALIVIQVYILIFSLHLGWLPAGWQGGWEGILSLSAVIPILVLALPGIFGMAHFVRTAALKAVKHSSVVAARSKGLSTFQILGKVVLPEVRGPLIIALTPVIFTFFEGSFFVEKIYGIPGLAVFLLESLFGRDYPVILNVGFLGVCLGLLTKIIEDVLQNTDRRVNAI